MTSQNLARNLKFGQKYETRSEIQIQILSRTPNVDQTYQENDSNQQL